MSALFSRKREVAILENLLKSNKAELIAIYGRRRVGITFLVREIFSSGCIFCEVTGEKDGPLARQLNIFANAVARTFHRGGFSPKNWDEAFETLTDEIKRIPSSEKIVLFFDELPWMATPRSGLLQKIDHYWNAYWSRIPNLKIVLCGSAASWILDNLINAKGGLYNRITRSIHLEPFNLAETKGFLKEKGVTLNERSILEIYMTMGGIVFYLDQIEKGKSATQIINDMCFSKDGLLYSEFDRLFKSLFDESHIHNVIIREIAKHRDGISRSQLIEALDVKSGGTLKKRLNELQSSGFIEVFVPFGNKAKEQQLRIIDEYSLFYLTWIEKSKLSRSVNPHYWESIQKTGAWYHWAGNAFEQICFKHIPQIQKALGLTHIASVSGSWRYIPKKGLGETGAQIDLLFDRDDNTLNICEIKFTESAYEIDSAYAKELNTKLEVFQKQTQTKKQLFLTLISVNGLKDNRYSLMIDNVVTLKDIFQSL